MNYLNALLRRVMHFVDSMWRLIIRVGGRVPTVLFGALIDRTAIHRRLESA
ncbi:hypothetical protein [Fischerella sp. JS2]|uniref:hypothetical protein n=1 Tax=Fischerella sp. JS2 TaxID=2597771 RepID=UPI0028E633B2|nr:hypothetical protein [Fischerella sp. JS2]